MKDILKSLYYGDICPTDYLISKPDIEKADKEFGEKEKQFLNQSAIMTKTYTTNIYFRYTNRQANTRLMILNSDLYSVRG
ncbi:MAG: hypothetical protein FWG33_04645 [Oscillospiraceae bacterium]|nr:hypothetical protein [Oscillospiraceae bacterium]